MSVLEPFLYCVIIGQPVSSWHSLVKGQLRQLELSQDSMEKRMQLKACCVLKCTFSLLSGHLTDNHLVDFLRRCQKGLRPNGLIVIKDNVSYEGVVPDEVDSSVCRDLEIVHSLVGRAGLRIIHEEQQMDFPKEIYQVHTLALR